MRTITIILLLIPLLAPAQKKKAGKPKPVIKKQEPTVVIEESIGGLPVMQGPQPLTNIVPTYPVAARKANLEGKVYLSAYIDVTGEVIHVMVDKPRNKILEDAAIKAIKKTRFTPGTMNGHKVKMWVKIPVEFSLDSD